jgi:hypothetical protein
MKVKTGLLMLAVAGLAMPAVAQQQSRQSIEKALKRVNTSPAVVTGLRLNGVSVQVKAPAGDAIDVIYDNWPAVPTNFFYSTSAAPTGRMDDLSFSPGPGAGGPTQITSIDIAALILPVGDPGGDGPFELAFYENLDPAAPEPTPVNSGLIGTVVVTFGQLPANTGTAAAGYIPQLPIDITAANIVVNDGDFAVVMRPLNADLTTTHPTRQIGFNGQPWPLPIGTSDDVYWRDTNADGVFTAADARFFNGPPNVANLALKFSGEIVGGGGPTCYANCDGTTAVPFLNVNDFICFQTKFAAGDTYANCDASTSAPVLNVNDFICFQTKFAAGCSAP